MNQLTQDTFLKLVESLRKHQRAELFEGDENLIEALYTDPFANDFVLKTMLQNQTTLLIGRKGTGKSTIINRFQHEIRKSKDKISLYIDVKSIYIQARESSPQINDTAYNILSAKEKEKYFIYLEFLKKVIEEIKKEINDAVFKSKISKLFFGGKTEQEFQKELDGIFKKESSFKDVTAFHSIKRKEVQSNSESKETTKTLNVILSPKVEVSEKNLAGTLGSLSYNSIQDDKNIDSELSSIEYSNILVRYFNIIELMNEIKSLLNTLNIKTVFICLDDASELEKDALETFIRTIVAPLNNSSEGFFRFKISFYPGRDVLPEIDRTKVETINLDYYNLYQSSGIDKVEDYAISYTKRLITRRFEQYYGKDVDLSDFFDTNNLTVDYYFRLLFFTSSNVPRFIGKILWYSAKQSIFEGKKITKSVIQEASKQLYLQEIKVVLFKNEYIQYRDYNERFEKEHLKNLVNDIIMRAKENKRHIGNSDSKIFNNYTTNTAPSNYLYFIPEYEELIASLELNFFITKFTQQKDRGSGTGNSYISPKEVSVYTINYGLCQSEDIIFDEKSDRKFRIERVFDFNNLINSWANSQKKILCNTCGAEHSLDKLDAIKMLGMICPACGKKTCEIITNEIKIVESPKQVPEKYFQVLNSLQIEDGLTVRDIALEIDYNRWTVSALIRNDRILQTERYIECKNINGKKHYYITNEAIKLFFNGTN